MNKILSCAAVVGLLIASSSSVFAKGPGGGGGGGASHVTPAFESSNPNLKTNPLTEPVPQICTGR